MTHRTKPPLVTVALPRVRARSRAVGLLASGLCLALAATLGPSPALAAVPAAGPNRPAPSDHIVFLALDGFDVDYLDDAPMPHLQQLLSRGTLTTSTGVMASITNPSWSSIATGAWPETHQNTAYWYNTATGVAVGQQRDLAVPTIAQAIRDQGGTVLSSQWFIVQNYGTTYGDPNGIYTQPGGNCARRTDDAVAVLRGEPVNSGGTMVTAPKIPDLIAVYCDVLDALGHADGDIAPGIPDGLRQIDEQIGRLVDAVKEADIYGRTTFVITGDHGMSTFTRGMDTELLATIANAGYKAQILNAGQPPAADTDAVIVIGGVGSLNLVGDAATDPAAAERIKAALLTLPHVRAVYDKDAQRAMHMSPKFGELVIEPESGWSLGATPNGPRGVHGLTENLSVPLVLAGAGVRPNTPPQSPRHIDLAPTMAALLGFEPPSGSQGRVLTESIRVG
jgi:predicted AlkP superfamily pyrophosphatase or phosphodiesterase